MEIKTTTDDLDRARGKIPHPTPSAQELQAQLDSLLYAFNLIRHHLPADENLSYTDQRALRLVEQVRQFSGAT